MPNNEDDFNNNPAFLRYQIEELKNTVYPLIKTVDGLDTKVSLLSQKILIATVLIGGAFQVFGLWYSNKGDGHSEVDKKAYYETRIQETDTVKALRDEIERLKKGVKQ